jgi:hypothetical protein
LIVVVTLGGKNNVGKNNRNPGGNDQRGDHWQIAAQALNQRLQRERHCTQCLGGRPSEVASAISLTLAPAGRRTGNSSINPDPGRQTSHSGLAH